jgi:hypothetical protein
MIKVELNSILLNVGRIYLKRKVLSDRAIPCPLTRDIWLDFSTPCRAFDVHSHTPLIAIAIARSQASAETPPIGE